VLHDEKMQALSSKGLENPTFTGKIFSPGAFHEIYCCLHTRGKFLCI